MALKESLPATAVNYPGTHSQNNTPTTDTRQTVLPTDARAVFFIPQNEVDQNKNLVQNP
ncbi:hypothetical protein [Dyadobacter sandarakinus]|uniref:Uncharacterized protein n=1 Tax=Dyadobacter sandarakinus TaxID=2747268 RepID=A0ABX7I2Y3_9BACT|nr:hypothetical protein [Dyadobacter sandarakinus]QRQ99876.1 hypothetical protein HWI92_02550 [Dyadobacter sandarakinus]